MNHMRTYRIDFFKILFLILPVFTSLFVSTSIYSQIKKLDEKNLEETMRNPWKAEESIFIKDWLVLGSIPITKIEDIDIDFLANNGGEKNITPVEGQSVKIQEGSEIKWQKHHSNDIIINLRKIFEHGRVENALAYAYVNIEWKEAGKALLCLGSDDGVKVWLNNEEVHRSLVLRGINIDEDAVEVNMKAGVNKLLIKVQQGIGDWGFALRIKEDLNNVSQFLSNIQFSISKVDRKNNIITVESTRRVKSEIFKQPINLQVYTTGGQTVYETKFQTGEPVNINYRNWKDGVYEFRLSYNHLDGKFQTYYLSWYKGDILNAAKDIVKSVPKGNLSSPADITHKMLADMIMNRLGGNLENPDSSKFKDIHSPIMEFSEMKANNQIRPGGFIRLAYIDDIDGTPQFCRVYLPLNYDPSKKWPMVVYLHGYNGDNPDYFNWWSASKRNDIRVDRYNIIFIEPHGRGNVRYLGIGDRDVLRCIDMAKEKFNVDEDRIYLNGESMGGGGTWHVGSRHPEIFAAIAPVFGGWDYHVYTDKEKINSLSNYEKHILEKNSSTVQFESLLNMPIYVFHGDRDNTVDVNFSRYLVRLLQRWGYNIKYWEIPEKGHGGLGHNDVMFEWLLQQKRNNNPNHVKIRSAELRTASAYWVKINRQKDPWEMMNADATVFENNIINVDTKNVLELILTPGEKLLNPKEPVKVIWNTELLTFDKMPDSGFILRSQEYEKSNHYKTPQLPGTINDFTNTPFAIIIGTTSKDNNIRKLIEQKANEIINNWQNQQKFKPRIIKDIDLTEDDMKKYSLHLLGGPKENKTAKTIFEKIPFKIEKNEYIIDGTMIQSSESVLDAVYPSPYNSQRYIRITASNSGMGMYFFNPQSGDLLNYDFYILDGKIPNSKAGFPFEKIVLASGMFDYNWKLNKDYLKDGDKQLREKCPEIIVNKDLSISVKGGVKVSKDLLESYVGSYQMSNQDAQVIISIKDGILMGQGPGGPPMQLYAYSESDFFLKEMDLQLSFSKEQNKMILTITITDQVSKWEKVK
jgi:pimeloyl-ACP methyl ester carboxylesterase